MGSRRAQFLRSGFVVRLGGRREVGVDLDPPPVTLARRSRLGAADIQQFVDQAYELRQLLIQHTGRLL